MSIHADLVCTRCDVRLHLGKAVHEDRAPAYYHLGPSDEPPNWARDELNAVLWKLLADHARHPLKVIIEGDPDEEPSERTVELGGDTTRDISFADYLRNWPGHHPRARRDPA
ncbi:MULTISPECIES: hypothetical protein [Actinomadura]|uniref:Uncharacterized protein n=1 Tax=Actinomadura yumaensis TaxID=111807 RepID=A0ABW2CI70_9ACTN|nr:hypothetical protein [Actinomadura sp. J1-007]MWK37074.1 hypothetical protein [Actinomadura sp. J1-007]